MKRLRLVKPALGRIAIELLTTDEKTAGGLWLPHGREKIVNVGRVIAVCDPFESGPDDDDTLAPRGPLYPIGTIVVFGQYNGNDIELGDRAEKDKERFTIINESDVQCILEEVEDGE